MIKLLGVLLILITISACSFHKKKCVQVENLTINKIFNERNENGWDWVKLNNGTTDVIFRPKIGQLVKKCKKWE